MARGDGYSVGRSLCAGYRLVMVRRLCSNLIVESLALA